MLGLDEGFFKEEIRCGFTVSSEMKHFWAAQMKVLTYITRICKKYNIQYFAAYGTLLGAIRHKGYIPWDDDIDIFLKRTDYMKLLSVLKRENNYNFAINNCYMRYSADTAANLTIFNYPRVPMPKSIIDDYFGCPYATGIDVYPLDYLPRDKELAEIQKEMYLAVGLFASTYNTVTSEYERENYIRQIEEMCNIKIIRDDSVEIQLWKLADKIASMFTEEESDKLAYYGGYVSNSPNSIYDKQWFEKTIEMQFETMEISVPIEYDKILKQEYGNYMALCRGEASHNYPLYDIQKKFLERLGKWYI